MWAVKPDSKFKTVKDVIEEAKKRPGTITLNGGGHGTDDHIAVLGIERQQPAPSSPDGAFPRHARGQDPGAGRPHRDLCRQRQRGRGGREGRRDPRARRDVAGRARSSCPNAPTFREQGIDEVWSVSRGIAGAGRPAEGRRGGADRGAGKDHRLAGAQGQGRGAGLDPEIIKGDAYRKFLKDNEQATKKLMNW